MASLPQTSRQEIRTIFAARIPAAVTGLQRSWSAALRACPTLYVNHHWKKSGGRVCSDIIPASSPLLCSAPQPHFPLPAQGVYRNVLFLKRPRRSLPRPLGDPVSQGAHPRSILCKNCTHGRGECRSPPPVISPVLRARASRH